MKGIQLFNFQYDVIDFLINACASGSQKIRVKSPTGSGKTIILIGYVEEYLLQHPNAVVCWLCPGKGDLEEQSREKMQKFSSLPNGDLADILNTGFQAGWTYFVNWETITKKDNRAITESENCNLYDRITQAHRANLDFVVIIDEEHLNNTDKADDVLTRLSAKHEIRVSATPLDKAHSSKTAYMEIDEEDVINEGLITKKLMVNPELPPPGTRISIDVETSTLLNLADKYRQEIRRAYQELRKDKPIRPLVLIQFPDERDDLIQLVEGRLAEMGYTYENGMVACRFSGRRQNLEGLGWKIEDNSAEPAFLLFKQALATGWDCPRAKVLVKLRLNVSEKFEIQTLGRLRRMPEAKHYDNEVLNRSILLTYDEKYTEAAIKEGGQIVQRVFLKPEVYDVTMVKEVRERNTASVSTVKVRKALSHYLKKHWGLTHDINENQKKLEALGFDFSLFESASYLQGEVRRTSDVAFAKKVAYKRHITSNTHGLAYRKQIDSWKRVLGANWTETSAIFKNLFLYLPKESRSVKEDRILGLSFNNYYAFILNNADKLYQAICSMPVNQSLFNGVVGRKELEFKFPGQEDYPINPLYQGIELEANVYKDYSKAMFIARSSNERAFEEWCDAHRDKIAYVYKNGDKGQDYLSIVFQNKVGKEALFYPDYVLILMDGTKLIVEIKGGGLNSESDIDEHSEAKFLAGVEYAKRNACRFAMVKDINGRLVFNEEEYTDRLSGSNWHEIDAIFTQQRPKQQSLV